MIRFVCAALVAIVFLTIRPAFALDVPSVFVSPGWLESHLGASGLAVIEVSSRVSYEFDGHIPGAALTTKGEWRVDEADGVYVRRQVSQLQDMIRALGVDSGDAVVIYAKGETRDDLLGAAYLAWVFTSLGHDNVALLDEGWSGWLAVGAPVQSEDPDIAHGTFTMRPRPNAIIDTDELYALHETATVVDARPASHFAGTEKFPANSKFGRIPGSRSQPWPDNVTTDMDGRLFMTSSAPRLVKAGTMAKDRPILITCFGGTGAAMAFMLLRHHGYGNLRLHDAGLRRWNVRNLPLVKD